MKSFSENASPLKFYNSICYRIGQQETKVKIKNDFFVSEITNLAENEVMVIERNKFCDQKGGTPVKVFEESNPNNFYVRYSKTQMDTWKY